MFTLEKRTTFGFSAENPTGTRNGGSRGTACEKLRARISIAPGETAPLCDIDGEGIITHMWFTGYIGHSFIIRIYWENNEFPSVEAPLSAFFGCAYDENFADRDDKYPVLNSSMILVAPGRAYNSYFEMPFKKHCKITMENRGTRNWDLYYMITGWLGKLPENIGYFHALYNQEHPIQKGRAYTVVDGVNGRGKFLGVTLASGLNGNNTCWVEGEVKMYIDGETYPSMNYTGTEDYFCGSFAFGNDIAMKKYQTFSAPYVGLYAILGNPDEQYNSQTRFMLYRFHVVDEIYFENGFRMTMDNLAWTGSKYSSRYDDYTTVAYYLLEEPQKLPFPLPDDNELFMK